MQTQKTSHILVNLRRLAAGLLCLLLFVIGGGPVWAAEATAEELKAEEALKSVTKTANEETAVANEAIAGLNEKKKPLTKELAKLQADADIKLKLIQTKHAEDSKAPLKTAQGEMNKAKKEAAGIYESRIVFCKNKVSNNAECIKKAVKTRNDAYKAADKILKDEQKVQDEKFKSLENSLLQRLGIITDPGPPEVIGLREQIDTIDAEINIENSKIEFHRANVKTALTALNKARGCPDPKDLEETVFEVELEAGFERLPVGKAITADGVIIPGVEGGRKMNEDTGTCFIWHGNEQNGRWYQLIEGGNSTDIMTAFARQIYLFLAGTVGLLSVLMIIVGGIQISVAGTNQEGLEAGKDRIMAAMAGLALLFLSSLILYTINPLFFGL